MSFRWLKLFSGTFAVLSSGFVVFVMFVWPFIDGWIRKRRPAGSARSVSDGSRLRPLARHV